MKYTLTLGLMVLCSAAVMAKLPAPSAEAKAKADEAAAKTAWSGKVDNYKLCKSQDQVADRYRSAARKAGKELGEPSAMPACVDPGPFVYTLPVAAPASAPAETKKG